MNINQEIERKTASALRLIFLAQMCAKYVNFFFRLVCFVGTLGKQNIVHQHSSYYCPKRAGTQFLFPTLFCHCGITRYDD